MPQPVRVAPAKEATKAVTIHLGAEQAEPHRRAVLFLAITAMHPAAVVPERALALVRAVAAVQADIARKRTRSALLRRALR